MLKTAGIAMFKGTGLRRSCFALLALLIGSIDTIATPAVSQTITEFPINSGQDITLGPDGAVWMAQPSSISRISITPTNTSISTFSLPTGNAQPHGITTGSDGALWFTEFAANKIGRMTTAGLASEFIVPTTFSDPDGIAGGPDGALWFTERRGNKIGRITIAGIFTEFAIPTPSSQPQGITAGSDGALWFVERAGKIGRITITGLITEFSVSSSIPNSITSGPDGALWVTAFDNKIRRVTTLGAITEFPLSTPSSAPVDIISGPDGALWFVNQLVDTIGRITTTGVITEFPVQTGSSPTTITAGSDGALWFTENGKVGRITTGDASQLLAATLPSSRSVQVGGNVATAFATILNNSGVTASGCGIVSVTSDPADFSFQETDPATNMLIGSPNQRVSIPPGGAQTFLVSFQPNAPYVSTEIPLGYDCTGFAAASTIVGVNTVLLTFDANPVADMIAVGLTPSNDGYSRIPGVGNTGIFVIASTNIGVTSSLTARARFLDPSTHATVTICETNSNGTQVGQCKATASPTVTRTINQNENTTWTAFITATGDIPQDPAKNRVIFQFEESNGVRGSTSTAVTTAP
jgi:virginiamycin B lyase